MGMKKTLFCTVLMSSINLFLIPNAIAETWSCSYSWNGEVQYWSRTRKGNVFTSKKAGTYQIIKEDEKKIHLYLSYPFSATYYAIVLNKQKRKFHMSALGHEKGSGEMSGPCSIIY